MLMFALLVQAITGTRMEQKEIPTCADFPTSAGLRGHSFVTLLKEGVRVWAMPGEVVALWAPQQRVRC